jgi:hypothetical protein
MQQFVSRSCDAGVSGGDEASDRKQEYVDRACVDCAGVVCIGR